MKGIIVYKSVYGSTKEYANWIAEETGFQPVSVSDVKKEDLETADTVIIGSPVLKWQPLLRKWVTKQWPVIQDKKVALYTTSGAPGDNPRLKEGFTESFPEEMQERIAYFPLGGRMIYENLSPAHKMMMKIGQRIEKDPKVKEEMVKSVDHVRREALADLLKHVKG